MTISGANKKLPWPIPKNKVSLAIRVTSYYYCDYEVGNKIEGFGSDEPCVKENCLHVDCIPLKIRNVNNSNYIIRIFNFILLLMVGHSFLYFSETSKYLFFRIAYNWILKFVFSSIIQFKLKFLIKRKLDYNCGNFWKLVPSLIFEFHNIRHTCIVTFSVYMLFVLACSLIYDWIYE